MITERSVIVRTEGQTREVGLSLIDERHDLVCNTQSFRLGFSTAMFHLLSKECPAEED